MCDVKFEIVSHEIGDGAVASAGVPMFGATVPCSRCGEGVFLDSAGIDDADAQ